MLEGRYSTDLSGYGFDKADCKGCPFNSSVYDLFADGSCGNCQNMECLRYKQGGYMAAEAARLLDERKNAAVCIAPDSFASAEVVGNLIDTGYEIYEMVDSRLPVEPHRPTEEDFASEAEYQEAEASYRLSMSHYESDSARIEAMVQQGRAQLLVDVSHRKPELCYRIVPEIETVNGQPTEEDTVEKLHGQDSRNREIAIEKAVEDVKLLVRESIIPDTEFQQAEEELVYYIMLSALRKENYGKLGFDTQVPLTDEEKAGVTASLTGEHKNAIRRDFIIKHLSDTCGVRRQSYLLLEFASLHFPQKVNQIKEQYNEQYKKRHIRIEERIRELQPYSSENAEEQPSEPAPTAEPAVTEIGDIPEEDGDIPEAVYAEIEEIAA
ncbi:MAG: hypothetical protein LBL04_13080 [Bacteroidales bacterium]|jgi:ParB family chromosome partitioning protein|nr:hypothetical protein [Bacteroidales bacterium]